MAKIELLKSGVRFDERTHTYDLNGKPLRGVTPIVEWVFPRTYEGIPEHVLHRAAEYGSAVHKACELFDDCGVTMADFADEVARYDALCKENGLKSLASEYLVSDEQDIASSIDKVFQPIGDEYPLADLKCTSQFHLHRVTLQLSIYAYLFERQTEKQAGHLFCIWLPKPKYGEARIFQVQRIPSDTCKVIIDAFLQGGDAEKCAAMVCQYCGALQKTDDVLPANLIEVEREIVSIEREAKELKQRSEELRAGLLELMQENGVKKWEGELITITRKDGGKRQTIDTAKVKEQFPEVYAQCIKESSFSESLTIKIKEK